MNLGRYMVAVECMVFFVFIDGVLMDKNILLQNGNIKFFNKTKGNWKIRAME